MGYAVCSISDASGCFYAVMQFEMRERQKRAQPEAVQLRRQNYVQRYMDQFLPPPEPVYVVWVVSSVWEFVCHTQPFQQHLASWLCCCTSFTWEPLRMICAGFVRAVFFLSPNQHCQSTQGTVAILADSSRIGRFFTTLVHFLGDSSTEST